MGSPSRKMARHTVTAIKQAQEHKQEEEGRLVAVVMKDINPGEIIINDTFLGRTLRKHSCLN